MTANFKRFRLKPTEGQGKNYNDGTPFIKYLMEKAVKGVSVQIICSNPSTSFMEEWQEYYKQMGKPDLFKYMLSPVRPARPLDDARRGDGDPGNRNGEPRLLRHAARVGGNLDVS